MNYFEDVKDTFGNIIYRLKNRDFSGNAGIAVKNSVYQIGTTIVSKIGALIFTIILARLLMPELFGLYSLALSTILIFATFSELGIGTAVVTFLSRELGKKNGKPNSYLVYFAKIKIFLILISVSLILISAKFVSQSFYQKPIFLALIAGALYIFATQIFSFLQNILIASNYFKGVFWREAIFQTLRIVLIYLGVIFGLKYAFSQDKILSLVILLLALSFIMASLFLLFDVKKFYFSKFRERQKIKEKQKSEMKSFIFATAVLVLSGTFFGNVDRIMLGKFIGAEFIGYYTAAFSLVSALTPLIGFASVVLLPMFSRMKGKNLDKIFRKSTTITISLSLATLVFVLVFAKFAILIAFGSEYLPALNILRILSLILIFIPLISLYQTYFISQRRPWTVARILVFSAVINIFLNYVLITLLLPFGEINAVYGASIATIISQGVLFGGFALARNGKRKNFKI